MPLTTHRAAARRVAPSVVEAAAAEPFTLDQELTEFGDWVGDPIWAPPLDSSEELAESMLRLSRPFTPREERWAKIVKKHRDQFTQVREIDLRDASIRLPKGRFFVSVTEQKHFDRIEEKVPACVQTRLEEFLAGPGQKMGVKVYYLKPLCVEVGDELIMTTREEMMTEIEKVRDEVFEQYRRRVPWHCLKQATVAAADLAMAPARALLRRAIRRREKELHERMAKAEFERRKDAMDALKMYRKCRTTPCTFDGMLALTNPPRRDDVERQFTLEKNAAYARRVQLLKQVSEGSMPWFLSLSYAVIHAYAASLATTAPLFMCDPAFVAEFPKRPGVLMKIGHFDVVDGVMHVEI